MDPRRVQEEVGAGEDQRDAQCGPDDGEGRQADDGVLLPLGPAGSGHPREPEGETADQAEEDGVDQIEDRLGGTDRGQPADADVVADDDAVGQQVGLLYVVGDRHREAEPE
nr:hypothetical protein [Streptomyces sp. GbtcB6]